MTVSLPGEPVMMPAKVVDEVVAAVSACIDNVLLHVGRSARSWILLEALPDRVEVSVRDEGPGIPAGRLEAAEAEGRLGVVRLDPRPHRGPRRHRRLSPSGSFGTEWELRVPGVRRDRGGSGRLVSVCPRAAPQQVPWSSTA